MIVHFGSLLHMIIDRYVILTLGNSEGCDAWLGRYKKVFGASQGY